MFWKFINALAVPIVTVPLALNVVNAPVDAVVAPMAVEFRPVEVMVPRAVPATLRKLIVSPSRYACPGRLPCVEPNNNN